MNVLGWCSVAFAALLAAALLALMLALAGVATAAVPEVPEIAAPVAIVCAGGAYLISADLCRAARRMARGKPD